MEDGLIRCGSGCGRPLTFERLAQGARGPNGIRCYHCVAERMTCEIVSALGLKDDEAAEMRARMQAWLTASEDA